MILPKFKMNVERWKFSKEYGVYVSTEGNFKDRRKRIIPIRINQKGYCSVRTEVGYVVAHRLVMMVWKPAPNMEQLTVDHLNHNKRDNSLDNLEWVTRAENVRRAKEDLLKPNDKEISFTADEPEDREVELVKDTYILANGIKMKMSDAIVLVKNMSIVNNATHSQIELAIRKALNGKNHNRYASIKFTNIKK